MNSSVRAAPAPSGAELARLFASPAEAGHLAAAARAAAFGRRVLVRPAPVHAMPRVAAILRGDAVLLDRPPWSFDHVSTDMTKGAGASEHVSLGMTPGAGAIEHAGTDMSEDAGDPGWPDPAVLQAGDRVVVQVDHARLPAYLDYLVRLAAGAPEGTSLAPVCARAGGLFRLHLIAAARLALPARVRVEVRHDLIGIRLAHVALAFGADTLSGPLAAGRRLPLAGVPRPDEASPEGLLALVERAGLEPVPCDLPLETLS